MARIHNTDTIKETIAGAKIQTSHDEVPQQLAKSIVPVMEVNPKLLRICNVVARGVNSDTVNATIYSVPADKDFYLNSAALMLLKDAGATSTYTFISVIIDGVTVRLLEFRGLTTVAQELTESISYPVPIKIDRGTNIVVSNATNNASIDSVGLITGYTVEGN